MITVEKGRPIPPPTKSKYPFRDMEIGDSFWVPDGRNAEATKNNVRSAATCYSRRNGGRFTVRRDNGGYRVWRTV